jgi:hypothetical protein
MKVSEIGNGGEGMGWDGWMGNASFDKTSRANRVGGKSCGFDCITSERSFHLYDDT